MLEERLKLRLELEELYADYVDALDSGRYDDWPKFFVEDCSYQIIPRENHDQGLPLATLRCESRGMLEDRVHALRELSTYGPRSLRHLVSGIRVRSASADEIESEADFCVLETLVDQPTRVFLTGRYLDRLVRQDGELLFRQRHCVFDSNLILNTLVVPV